RRARHAPAPPAPRRRPPHLLRPPPARGAGRDHPFRPGAHPRPLRRGGGPPRLRHHARAGPRRRAAAREPRLDLLLAQGAGAARHRVHAIGLPGYGFSDKPADAPYDPAWFAHVVVGYLDAAGVRRAVLVGNSMGGQVASETAILYPERTAGLVLLGAAGLPEAERDGRPLSLRMLTWPVLRPPTLVITGDTDRLVPLETARAYHALIAGSELLVLERTGHLPQEERPERVVAEITRWVQVSAARD